MDADKQDLIRARAYALWIEAGRPSGSAHENWLRAEREIEAERRAAATASPVRVAVQVAPAIEPGLIETAMIKASKKGGARKSEKAAAPKAGKKRGKADRPLAG